MFELGTLQELYSLVYDAESMAELAQDAEDDEPACRVLFPPVTNNAVDEAEQGLGFPLPPLLRGVYTQIGNGGLCLHLLGLQGGQTGGDDLFPGMSIVEIYQEIDSWRRNGKLTYLPPQLLPINDSLGCGMVDYVDCRTPTGQIWRSDSGMLFKRQPSLLAYFREAITEYSTLTKSST